MKRTVTVVRRPIFGPVTETFVFRPVSVTVRVVEPKRTFRVPRGLGPEVTSWTVTFGLLPVATFFGAETESLSRPLATATVVLALAASTLALRAARTSSRCLPAVRPFGTVKRAVAFRPETLGLAVPRFFPST